VANSFLTELKRRNVIRIGGAYLVISWLLLQVGDTLFNALNIDQSANSLLLAILVLGFIPTVVFAWVFELTANGIMKQSDIDQNISGKNSITSETATKLNKVTILAVVLLAALILWDRYSEPMNVQQPPMGKAELVTGEEQGASIAVMPFADMSSAGDQEYFGDGIAEELLNVLAKAKGLRVAARTSSFKFKNQTVDIKQIGDALNVKTVLEGSIRKSGDQVRITAQLINVADGYHIWSESYDRELKNIFKIQDEIANSIVDTLKVELNLGAKTENIKNVQAYDDYLKGRNIARSPTKANLLKAIDLYNTALELEPDFEKAYSGIASAWIWLEDYGGFTAKEAFPKMEFNARKALTLDSTQAEAMMSMGIIYKKVYSDPLAAVFFFEQAIKINPSLTEIYTHYADVLNDLGKFESSLEQRRMAIQLDPLSTFYRSRYANALTNSGKIDEAEKEINEIFKIDPNDAFGLEELGYIQKFQAKFAESTINSIKIHALRPGDAFAAAKIATRYHYLGDEKQTNYWSEQARARGENNRWELNARVAIAVSKADWKALLEVSSFKSNDDELIASSWAGYALMNMGQLKRAREKFDKVVKQSKLLTGRLQGENHYTALGLTLMTAGTSEHQGFVKLAEALYQSYISKNNPTLSNPSFYAHFGLACVKISSNTVSNELSMDVKNEILQLLTRAVDSGFRDSLFLQNSPFFKNVQTDRDFLDIVKRINTLNDLELQKLRKMVQELAES